MTSPFQIAFRCHCVALLATALFPVLAQAQQKQLDTISRFAIAGTVGQTTRFQRPCAIAVSPIDGRVFVSDTNPGGGGNRIVSYPSISAMTSKAPPDVIIGDPGAQSNYGDSSDVTKDPEALAIDKEGSLYVADTTGHRVMIFRAPFKTKMAASVVLGQDKFSWASLSENRGAAVSPGGMKYPRGLALDSKDNLWVADDNNKRVLRFTRGPQGFKNGQLPSLIIGSTVGAGAVETVPVPFSGPKALAVDSADRLFVTDYYNQSITRFEAPYKTAATVYQAQGRPIDLAVTPYGDLYVTQHETNGGAGKLLRFTNAGTAAQLTLNATMPTANAKNPALSQLGAEPLGVCFDSTSNKLLVADYGQARIFLFARYAFSAATPNGPLWAGTADTVKQLQSHLNAQGETPPLAVNGIANPATLKAAIKDLQTRLNANGAMPALKVDGILSPAVKIAAVKELQEKLNAAGATPPLDVDGLWGAKTTAALKAFQTERGITADGIAGPETWAAL